MEYISTRGMGSFTGAPKLFLSVLLSGLAPYGGLYLLTVYPLTQVTKTELERWRTLSYTDLADEVIGKSLMIYLSIFYFI
ncbi:Threonine synthase [Candidatus Pandoraea novymonadis]|uniref:Threonine synthase n=1 Tax=Candidatus Pandoraea novymonadis TaxID=1808959 RepID=A0ABX5FGC9_9BURK|nr:Threonine synthase [Candidatus Pandoraea novymonadis]